MTINTLGMPAVVSVIVPTRSRPQHIADCVASVLAADGVRELIVIDQSVDRDTALVVEPLQKDPRLRYVRSTSLGSSRARNEGAALATSEILAFTDDDCRVAPDWGRRIAAVLADGGAGSLVCGRVAIPEGVNGFAAAFEPDRRELQHAFPPPERDWGISANMAVGRASFELLGGFDELLGTGAPLRSGADYDFIARALRAGMRVINASEVHVLHLGIRAPGAPTALLLRGYAFGAGAFVTKQARLGGSGRALFLRWLGHLLARNVRGLVNRERYPGLRLTVAFIQGAIASLRFPIDRRTGRFTRRSRARDR
jgi:glycosyltransferase involved in cell wall biosynthesis